MATKYPAAIDTVFTLKPLVDGQPVTGRSVEQLREAIIAIEEELGVKPSGVYATVRNRLDVIEGVVGNLRIIELEGDLGGTLETPKMIGIQGRPVSDVEPTSGQTLIWNGIAWIPGAIPADITFAGDLSGNSTSQTVVGIQDIPVSSDPGNNGDVLTLESSPINVNTFTAPQSLATDGTFVWIGNFKDKSIDKINLSNRQAEHINLSSSLPGGGSNGWARKIIYNGDFSPYLFVAGMDANRVLVIERNTSTVIGIGDCGSNRARSCTVDNLGNVWVGEHSGVRLLMRFVVDDLITSYPTPVSPASTVDIGFQAEEITFDGTNVWAVGGNGDVDRVDPTGDGTNTGNFNVGAWLADVVAVYGGVWVLDQANRNIYKFDPDTFPSGPVDTVNIANLDYGRAMTYGNGFLWVPDTSNNTGSNLFKIGINPLTIVDTIPPPDDVQEYFEGKPDPTLNRIYVAVLLSSDTDNQGFRIFDATTDTLVDSFNKLNLSGINLIHFAPASGGGGGGGNTFTYRPGGADDAASNVFTSWTALMAARSTLTSEATIILDDTGSGTPGSVTIDTGIWDLTANTRIVGYSQHGHRIGIIFGDGSDDTAFQNPFEFKNVIIHGPLTEITGTIQVSGLGTAFRIKFTNVDLDTSNGSIMPLFTPNAQMVFELYGDCSWSTDGFAFWLANSGTLTVNVYDSCFVNGNVFFANNVCTLRANIFSGGAQFLTQNSFTGTIFIKGENLFNDFDTADVGAIPIKTDVGITTWNAVPGGSLGNTYQNPTVVQVDGDGTNVNITCPQQTSTANTTYQPFSEQAEFAALGGFDVIYSNYNIPASTGVQVDVAITVIDSTSTHFATWKLAFGALRIGAAAAVTIGAVPSPSGVQPDRSTAGIAANWFATVVLSGNNIQVKGQAFGGAHWGISFQVFPLTP